MENDIKIKNVKQPIGEANNFLRYAIKSGNSIVLTIPKEVLEFEGIKEGDLLKVWIKKVYEK